MILRFLLHIFIQFTPNLTAKNAYIGKFFFALENDDFSRDCPIL